jgi:hypothetical protein
MSEKGRVLPGASIPKPDLPAWAMTNARERTFPPTEEDGKRSLPPFHQADFKLPPAFEMRALPFYPFGPR